jgi:RHS repeat-associated protein
LLTGSSGSIVSRFAYDAYGLLLGQTLGASLLPPTAYLHSGEQFDPDLQHYYLRARYYDPATGRFNRLDPFAGDNFDPQSLHKYAYAHADPVNGIDPSGQFTIIEVVAVVAIILILALFAYGIYAYFSFKSYGSAKWRTLAIYTGAVTIAGYSINWTSIAQRIESQTNLKVVVFEAPYDEAIPRPKHTKIVIVQTGSLDGEDLAQTRERPLIWGAYKALTTFDEDTIKSVATSNAFITDPLKMATFLENIATHESGHAAGIFSEAGEGAHPSIDPFDIKSLMYPSIYRRPKTDPPVFRSLLTTTNLLFDQYSIERINRRIGDER